MEIPGKPDAGLAPYLISAIEQDKSNGGDGDAVALMDCFGNLLMCKPGMTAASPIRTAYMETIRAYHKLRYGLTALDEDALSYLRNPKLGTIVKVKGYDKSARSFADFGAYGSTMFGADKAAEGNLQYVIPQMCAEELKNIYQRYDAAVSSAPAPEQVADQALIEAVTRTLTD